MGVKATSVTDRTTIDAAKTGVAKEESVNSGHTKKQLYYHYFLHIVCFVSYKVHVTSDFLSLPVWHWKGKHIKCFQHFCLFELNRHFFLISQSSLSRREIETNPQAPATKLGLVVGV